MFFRHLVLFLSLVTTGTIVAQDPIKTSILSSKECSIVEHIVAAINQAGPGWYIGLDSPYLSHQKIIDALCTAAQEWGVMVSVNTRYDTKRHHIFEQLQNAGVAVYNNPFLHTKRIIVADMIPNIPTVKVSKSMVFIGSDNLTNLSAYHVETITKTENDIDLFYAHYSDHCLIRQQTNISNQLSPIKVTPKRRMASSSLSKNMMGSILCRLVLQPAPIKKIKTDDGIASNDDTIKSDRYEFSSMSFDSENIVRQIEALLAPSELSRKIDVRFFLSQRVLLRMRSRDQLDRLVDAGAEVFVYNPAGTQKEYGYSLLQHSKAFVRRYTDSESNERYLYMPLTGNLTEHADFCEINAFELHPDDKDLAERQFAINERLRVMSIPYANLKNGTVYAESYHENDV